LAVLGTITHLYGAMTLTALSDEFDEADTGAVLGLTAYSYFSGFACLAGAIGVLKVDTTPFLNEQEKLISFCIYRTTSNIFVSLMLIIGLI
jgi:hypothetical protein